MKVPFIKSKIKNDFNSYFDDFEMSLSRNLTLYKAKTDKHVFFSVAYPLLVLLECLTNSDYFVDPSKKIILSEYILKNDKVKFLDSARVFSAETEETRVLRDGVLKQQFTPYFDELYSDLLLLLNNYYLCNYRGCYISLRCILEDLYRHLYYKDHMQEYWALMNGYSEHEIGLKPIYFREYLSRVSYLEPLNNVNQHFEVPTSGNIFSWNNELYSKTSSFVHASDESVMNKFVANSDLIYKAVDCKRVDDVTKSVVNLAVAFLVCAHLELFLKFNDYEKSIILGAFSPSEKKKFRILLNL